jgi:hypothetical protein
MGFNLATAIGGALQGFAMTGNPIGAVAGGVTGGITGGGAIGATGAATNGTLSLSTSSFLAGTEALNEQNLGFQLQLQAQAQQFDQATSEKSELMREQNELRNVAMEQRKADIEITKEFVVTLDEAKSVLATCPFREGRERTERDKVHS